MGDAAEGFRALKQWNRERRGRNRRKNLDLVARLREQGVRVDTLDEAGGHYRVYNEAGDHGDMWLTTETAMYEGQYQRGSGPRWLLNQLRIEVDL